VLIAEQWWERVDLMLTFRRLVRKKLPGLERPIERDCCRSRLASADNPSARASPETGENIGPPAPRLSAASDRRQVEQGEQLLLVVTA
jgi:hypothetical protein